MMIENKDTMGTGFDPNSFYTGQVHAAIERQRQIERGSPMSPQQRGGPSPYRAGGPTSSPNSSPGSSPHKDEVSSPLPYPPHFLPSHFSQRTASEYGLMPSPLSHPDMGNYAGNRHQNYNNMVSPNDPTANACKVVEFHGEKIAAFSIHNKTMLCLPQAFEMFLKNLVGGLHTVYTKCKRLDIHPLVCNVEQVRVLRGLGAIQPGVNRCKLIADSDFEELMKDCNTSRPGRPPKRMTPLTTFSQMTGAMDPFFSISNGQQGGIPFPPPTGHHTTGLPPPMGGLAPGVGALPPGAGGVPPGFPPMPNMMGGMLGGRGGIEHQMAVQAALLSRNMNGPNTPQSPETMLNMLRQLQGLHKDVDREEKEGVSPPTSPHPVLNLSGYKMEESEEKDLNKDDISENKSVSDMGDLDDDDDDEMSDNSMDCKDSETIQKKPVDGSEGGEKNMNNMIQLMSHIQDLVKTAITNVKEEKTGLDNKEDAEKDLAVEKETLANLKKQSDKYLKKFKREKKLRRKIQQQLEIESFKKAKYEEALLSLSNKAFYESKDLHQNGDNESTDKENFAGV